VLAVFEIGFVYCSGWPQTSILLISASWVARITGVSYQCLALKFFVEVFSINGQCCLLIPLTQWGFGCELGRGERYCSRRWRRF
jgi:hypothetical protein